MFAVEKLDGAWFECEFSGKTSQPTDNCEMLDNDGNPIEEKLKENQLPFDLLDKNNLEDNVRKFLRN